MSISAAPFAGPTPIPGLESMAAIVEITWDDSSLVTGEPLDLTDYFSTVNAIVPAGCSAIGLAGYIPNFVFTNGAENTSSNVLAVLMRMPALSGNAENAQPLVPADALNVAALGTTYAIVFGKAAIS
jgi:hypothetical protein